MFSTMHLVNSRCVRSLFAGVVAICLLLGATLNSEAMEHKTRPAKNNEPCSEPPARLRVGLNPERELGTGECHSYELTLSANQFLHIAVEQKGIDVILTIYDQHGTKLAEVDRPNGSRGPETISLIAPVDGSYLLSIRSYDHLGTRGTYDITFTPPRMAVRDDAMQIHAERLITEAEKLRGSAKTTREAVPKFRQAAGVWRSLGNAYEEAVALYGAGYSCFSIGDNQAAIDHLNRALRLFVQLKNTSGEAIVKSALGWPYLYLSDLETAYQSFNQALQSHRGEQNVRGEGIALYGMGWVQALRGETQQSLDKFSESLVLRQKAMDRRGEALTLTGMAKIQSRLGRHSEALKNLRLAQSVLPKKDPQAEADILSNLGWVHQALNENDKALSFFKTALGIRREIADLVGEATTRYGMSIAYYHTGRFSEAEQEIEEALRIIESLRAKGSNELLRISYFASVQDYYEFYITFLIQLDQRQPQKGYAAKALHACERARARGLLDLLGNAAITQFQPLTASEIQNQILDENTLLLQFVLSEKRSFLLAATPNEITTYELPPRAEIERVARQLYEAFTVRNHLDAHQNAEELRTRISQADSNADGLARALSQMLFSAVANKLTKKRLIVLTSGALQFIPFAALPVPLQSTPPGTLLIDNHELIVLPSMTALHAIRQDVKTRTPPAKAVIVLADPVFDTSDGRLAEAVNDPGASHPAFPRLISSRWEGEQILALVPPGEGKLVTDFAANRTFALTPEVGRFRFVHFATHAVIDFEHPGSSGIVLSAVDQKGKPQTGFLGMDDIFKLKIPVDLVVLSGCRTALGKDYAGEGLVGLTRAFMYAGASRVAVSLWQVGDKPTSELMVRFYKFMLGPEKLAPAAALRAAQLELRRDRRWRSPYFWAPFILQGDWR